MGGSTKRWIGDIMTFGLAEPFYYQPKSAAQAQANAQKEANRQAEIVAKRNAGMTPEDMTSGNDVTEILRKKSALRKTFITNSTRNQKLGD